MLTSLIHLQTSEKRQTIQLESIKGHSQSSKDVYKSHPILFHPDPCKPHYLITNASKYCWGATLCQYTPKSNSLDDLKHITSISGKFSDTQCNYAALVREAFAIYMSLKRFSFYLQDAEFTILCDHKPLEEFLKG